MLDMLNDKLCSAKPTKPVKKRGDGGGLYLLVKVREEAVSRVWQFEYSRPNQLKGRKKRNVLGSSAARASRPRLQQSATCLRTGASRSSAPRRGTIPVRRVSQHS